nr:hypothetical protein CFP56_26483 [Quercus suber]
MKHVVEGLLKGMMEVANKDKALKQVVEASLSEKTLELNVVEQQAITTEKAWELVEQKVGGSSSLPDTSPFKSADQIPLPKNPQFEAQSQEQSEDGNEREEGAESPEMRKLSQQINSQVVVLDEDNPATTTPTVMQGPTQPILCLAFPIAFASEVPLTSPAHPIIRTLYFVKLFNYVT